MSNYQVTKTSTFPILEKLSGNRDNIILLYTANNVMSRESIITYIKTLLIKNNKILLSPWLGSLFPRIHKK